MSKANIFSELGFADDEAARLEADSDRVTRMKKPELRRHAFELLQERERLRRRIARLEAVNDLAHHNIEKAAALLEAGSRDEDVTQ